MVCAVLVAEHALNQNSYKLNKDSYGLVCAALVAEQTACLEPRSLQIKQKRLLLWWCFVQVAEHALNQK